MTILDDLADYARLRSLHDQETIPYSQMRQTAEALVDGAGCGHFAFEDALRGPGIHFICECKKASPSKGLISPDFPYKQIARDYEEAGADAISCLTEPRWFQGKDSYVTDISQTVSIPILRKDFTVDDYMIYQAKVIGASAVLLICSLLDDRTLTAYRQLAESLGMSALIEAHDADEVKQAVACGGRIIGVNNRDLRTFTVDIANSMRYRDLVPANAVYVSESGIHTSDDIRAVYSAGVNAVLIGESLMRSTNKKGMIAGLRQACEPVADDATRPSRSTTRRSIISRSTVEVEND